MSSNLPWSVLLAKEAAKQLEKLPRDRQELVRSSLREMTADPFRGDVIALKGKEWKGRYRKRAGQYRIIFQLNRIGHTVEVSAVVPRSEKTYRQ